MVHSRSYSIHSRMAVALSLALNSAAIPGKPRILATSGIQTAGRQQGPLDSDPSRIDCIPRLASSYRRKDQALLTYCQIFEMPLIARLATTRNRPKERKLILDYSERPKESSALWDQT